MAGEELQVVRLRDDFYRDGFYKIVIALFTIIAAIALLVGISIYIYTSKPQPVYFDTDGEWRVIQPVPVDQVYLKTPDLVQWVSEVIPAIFTFDFVNYRKQLQETAQYFTTAGWQKYLDQLNNVANYNVVTNSKLFINARPAGAPFILNQGLLNGKYSWWIQMLINVDSISASGTTTQPLVVQALIVRVSTLNNLYGVGIENIIVNKGKADQIRIINSLTG